MQTLVLLVLRIRKVIELKNSRFKFKKNNSKDDSKKVIRKPSKAAFVLAAKEVPPIIWTRCEYREQLLAFVASGERFGIIRHPFGNNMAAASSVMALSKRDPDIRGKILACTRGGQVYVTNIT